METLFDASVAPNIAYLLLAGGLIFATLSILSPGTGVLEILAGACLLLAGGYVFVVPVNAWALLVLLGGAVLFVMSVRHPRPSVYLVASVGALVIGSAFLFATDVWWKPAVNIYLAMIVSVVSAGFFWFAARKSLEISQKPPMNDLGALIGAQGEARSAIHVEGSALVAGELWSAYSEHPIPEGARLRVVGREGLMLKVEAAESQAD